MIKAVFFDLADTLIYKPGLYQTIYDILQSYNKHITLARIEEAHKDLYEKTVFPDRPDRAFYVSFNKTFIKNLNIDFYPEIADEIFYKCKNIPWKIFDDVLALRGIPLPLGILSNFNVRAHDLIKHLMPDIAFRWVFISEDERCRKPDLEIFHRVLEKTKLLPEEIIYIGDSITLDMEPAWNIGMPFLLIDRYDRHVHYNGKKIKSLTEIRQFLI